MNVSDNRHGQPLVVKVEGCNGYLLMHQPYCEENKAFVAPISFWDDDATCHPSMPSHSAWLNLLGYFFSNAAPYLATASESCVRLSLACHEMDQNDEQVCCTSHSASPNGQEPRSPSSSFTHA